LESIWMRNPYESLGVSRSATADDIKKSFRALAKRLHPDVNNNDAKAGVLFAQLNAAYQILGDEQRRRAFDQGEIDGEGNPMRRVTAPARPSTWHIVARLTVVTVVAVMLAAASMLIERGITSYENMNSNSDGRYSVLSQVGVNQDHLRLPRSHELLHFEWLQKPSVAPDPVESAAANAASESAGAMAPSEGRNQPTTTAVPTDQNAIQHTPESPLGREPVELLIGLTEELLSEGEAETVRMLLRPAAEARDARAALALGSTYDPIMLAMLQARGVLANLSVARDWYEKAGEFGSREAKERLNLLSSSKIDGGASAAVSPTKALRKVEPRTAARYIEILVGSARPKRQADNLPIHVTAPPKWPNDAHGVYVAGARVGADPDPNIRMQLMRDRRRSRTSHRCCWSTDPVTLSARVIKTRSAVDRRSIRGRSSFLALATAR
jgi:DnaJ domain